MAYSDYQNVGNGLGYLYVTDTTGLITLHQYPNDSTGALMIKQYGLQSIPRIGVNDTTDSIVDYRFWIDVTGIAGPPAPGVAVEITEFVVQQEFRSTTANLLAGVITIGRLARIMSVEVNAGGVSQPFDTLTIDGVQLGDEIELYALGGTSFIMQPGGGNITSGSINADYTSASSAEIVRLSFDGSSWTEIGRVEQNPVSVADLVAAGIPESPSGVTNVALVPAGATFTLDPRSDSRLVKLTAGGALVANNVFTGSNLGTEIVGDYFVIWANGQVATNAGGSILVGAKVIDDDSMAAGGWKATLVCTSIGPSVWTCASIEFDSSVGQIIANSHIVDGDINLGTKGASGSITNGLFADNTIDGLRLLNASIPAGKFVAGSISYQDLDSAAKLTMNVIPVSFESGEQAKNYIEFEYNTEAFQIYWSVTKAIAAVDNGTIEFQINDVTLETITIPAGTAINTDAVFLFAAPLAIAPTDRVSFLTSKVTAGGKVLLTLHHSRQ